MSMSNNKHSLSPPLPSNAPAASSSSSTTTTATLPSASSSTSKLPKFLQRQSNNRDRSKSVTTVDPSPSPGASSVDSAVLSTPSTSKFRKGSKFLGRRDKEKEKEEEAVGVVVEPVAIPRARSDHQRPLTSAPDSLHLQYHSSSAAARIGDLPTRLSGWFSHTFSSSTTDLSLNSLLSQSSPKSKASAFLTVAKHGKGHLDKAMRYLLDSDAMPDKCTDPIWLLGVQHPGYEPPSPVSPAPNPAVAGAATAASLRSSTSSVASNAEIALALSSQGSAPSSYSSSSAHGHAPSSISSSSNPKTSPAAHWPPVFYIDFVSRIWLTYRSHFLQPIKDTTLVDLCAQFAGGTNLGTDEHQPTKSRWHWGGEKTWSSDSGWGCMLRTGQSLLANALIHAHLGRDWRRPPYPVYTADYATYVQILTWFFDTPSPEAPFSVHRMALAGKEAGTDVGQWFGPSVAAGAIKRLTNAFPQAGLGVSVAKDGVLSQTDVFLASHFPLTDPQTSPASIRSPRGGHKPPPPGSTWGDRPVLVLIGLRLGIEGVNPIYYDTIKTLFTFPQCIGIAGGRPSSSYYFVGSQADNLFYLDPHNPRPAIPLRPLPPTAVMGSVLDLTSTSPPGLSPSNDSPATAHLRSNLGTGAGVERKGSSSSSSSTRAGGKRKDRVAASYHSPSPTPPSSHHSHGHGHGRVPTSPTTSTSTYSSSTSAVTDPHVAHVPVSPSPLQKAFSGDEVESGGGDSEGISELGERKGGLSRKPGVAVSGIGEKREKAVPISVVLSQSSTTSTSTTTTSTNNSNSIFSNSTGLDPFQEHFVTSYSAQELKTYHCERVRKMPLSGLDPSMLLGFLVKSREEWEGLRRGVEDLPRSIFSIQNEHPNWAQEDYDDESVMGLESLSEPDAEEDEESEDDDDDVSNSRDDEEEEDDDDDDELDMDLEEKDEGEKKRRRTRKVNRNLLPDDDDDEEEEEVEVEGFYVPPISRTTSEASASTSASATSSSHSHSHGDTEEDPVEALTPGPNSKFNIPSTAKAQGKGKGKKKRQDTLKPSSRRQHEVVAAEDEEEGEEDDEGESDIEDGWVDSVDLGVLGVDDDEDEDDNEDVGRGGGGGGGGEEGELEQGVVTPLAGSTIQVVNLPSSSTRSSAPASARTLMSPDSIIPPTVGKESSSSSSSSSLSKAKAKSKSKSSSSTSTSKAKSSTTATSRHGKAKSDTITAATHSQSHSRSGNSKKKKDKKAVPVPIVSLPSSSSTSSSASTSTKKKAKQENTYFPFPGSGPDGDFDEIDFPHDNNNGDESSPVGAGGGGGGGGVGAGPGTRSWERGRYESQSWAGPGVVVPSANSAGGGGGAAAVSTGGLRMFAGKGRDGGRTQSGGVKGILTDS
ncbi:Cysteine protease ATG4 [Leucoagaricus sp. SymC.cos]|nr:Cysteine protease ATG4 [Leucoagaricus sp. SymC.cos]